MLIPREEYPRPQLVRKDWINLNGKWQFEFDPANTGRERGRYAAKELNGEILVPFCPESRLSGIADREFHPCVWYLREISMPDDWRVAGKRVLLHFGACDYFTEVYINGMSVGTHLGGMTPFTFDITDFLTDGKDIMTVCATDNNVSPEQPAGKQSGCYYSNGASYTRTTGIWQTVWLELVPTSYIERFKYTPDIENSSLYIELTVRNGAGKPVKATATYEGKEVGSVSTVVKNNTAMAVLKLDELYLWDIDDPKLYNLDITVGEDKVESYFGMRSVEFDGQKFRLNGRKVFQRLVLDQGYYPDGILTAPSDQELLNDIKRSKAMGFNGARLHQKIFEERFLYYCDLLGYIVWDEFYDWGLNTSLPGAWKGILPEWLELLQRDYSHPAIVGWCPLNEILPQADYYLVKMLVDATHAFDPTRPVLDVSGMTHKPGLSDYLDIHDYDQSAESLRKKYEPLERGEAIEMFNFYPVPAPFVGKPVFISEYGGMKWVDGDGKSDDWGYDEGINTREEWIARLRELTEVILNNSAFSAFCYTQLTDIEQEVNGLYTFDRREKFDPKLISEIITMPSAYEAQE